MSSLRIRTRFLSWCVCIAVASVSTVATAVPISIFNTGVDAIGNAIVGDGVLDTHYSFFTQPAPATATAVTVDPLNYPFPAWVANNAQSRWIGPGINGSGNAGLYIYRTTFNLPANAILGSASITGDWAKDDNSNANDIRINGISTGQNNGTFTAVVPFSVGSGFVIGTNTLDFYVNNQGGPTGLRVDHILGNYQIAVPEPSTAILIAAASLISMVTLRRKRSV